MSGRSSAAALVLATLVLAGCSSASKLLNDVTGENDTILPGKRESIIFPGRNADAPVTDSKEPIVLASDNCYLYCNLAEKKASATFGDADRPANIENQERMIRLAGSVDRVVPGHDARQFERFPTQGRVAKIR